MITHFHPALPSLRSVSCFVRFPHRPDVLTLEPTASSLRLAQGWLHGEVLIHVT